MKAFHYNTINCGHIGKVTLDNFKEFADIMVNGFGVASYNENGISVSAIAFRKVGYVEICVTIKTKNGEEKKTICVIGKRVSEGMGRSIYLELNDIINSEIEKQENETVEETEAVVNESKLNAICTHIEDFGYQQSSANIGISNNSDSTIGKEVLNVFGEYIGLMKEDEQKAIFSAFLKGFFRAESERMVEVLLERNRKAVDGE